MATSCCACHSQALLTTVHLHTRDWLLILVPSMQGTNMLPTQQGSKLLKAVLGMRRDLPLLYDAATVNASFNALPKQSNGVPANETLQEFLAANFGTAGSDFEAAVPDDFSSEPDNFLPNVTEPAIRQWALAVNDLWQDLCREVWHYKRCSLCPPVGSSSL